MWRHVYREIFMIAQKFFHLDPIIPLQERADGPHQSEDVEMLVVFGCQLRRVLVVLVRYQSRQQLGRLGDQERLQHLHFEHQILRGVSEKWRERSLE